jgi:hypothetical protein
LLYGQDSASLSALGARNVLIASLSVAPSRRYRLGNHFIAGIPNARTISPITHANWEGVGQ